MTKREIKIEELNLEQLQNLFGVNDSNINLLELRYKTNISYKNNIVYFEGTDDLERELSGVINALVNQVKKGY
jgi:phosphate starvation-inducible protein PhoH